MSALKNNQQITNFLKRSSESDSVDDTNEPAAKRSRFGDPSVTLTTAEFRAATKQDLVAHIIALQKDKTNSAKADPAPTALTPEVITAKADDARWMMVSGIKNQMKWKPSCKEGRAKFTYDAFVPDAAVFYSLFNVPADFKKKQIVMTPDEFQDKVTKSSIRASVRYSELVLTGEKVRITWNKDKNTFSVSGSYGKW